MAILTDKQSELWVDVDGYVSSLEERGHSFDDIVKILREYGEILEELN
nr:hypothetical protein [uncultured Mediterranean phage uvMED]BAR25529.1 hypothetical protein [uncultured Mediterranean phage uvMED]